jgi:hypothetical protein
MLYARTIGFSLQPRVIRCYTADPIWSRDLLLGAGEKKNPIARARRVYFPVALIGHDKRKRSGSA